MRVVRARLWLDVVLAVMAVVLGLWIFLSGSDEEDAAEKPLTTLDTAKVQRLILTKGQDETIELLRKEGGWWLQGPAEVPANEQRVGDLLGLLKAPVLSNYPVKSLRLEEVGLAPPLVRISADGKLIALGGVNPLTLRRYALVGEDVKLISDSYQDILSAARPDYVSPRLIPPQAQLRKLTLPALSIERQPQGWLKASGDTPTKDAAGAIAKHMALPMRKEGAPIKEDATARPVKEDASADDSRDTESFAALASAWKDARAIAVSLSDDVEAMTDVKVLLETGQEIRFLIVAHEPELVLARPDIGLAYHFNEQQAAKMLPGQPKQPEPVAPLSETQAKPEPPKPAEPVKDARKAGKPSPPRAASDTSDVTAPPAKEGRPAVERLSPGSKSSRGRRIPSRDPEDSEIR